MAVRERWRRTSPIRWSTPRCTDLVLAPVVAFSVLRDGKLLHYRDADRLNDIERRLTLLYRDHMLYLQRRRSRRSGIPAVQPPDDPPGAAEP